MYGFCSLFLDHSLNGCLPAILDILQSLYMILYSYIPKKTLSAGPKGASCTKLTVLQSNSKGSLSSRRKNGTFIYPLIILTVQNGIIQIAPDSAV